MALSKEEARAILIHSKCCRSCKNGKSCEFDSQPKNKQVWFSNKVNVYYLQLARESERLHIPEDKLLEYAKSFFEGDTDKLPKEISVIFKKHQHLLSKEADRSYALAQRLHTKCCKACPSGSPCGFHYCPSNSKFWKSNRANVLYLNMARSYLKAAKNYYKLSEDKFVECAKHYSEGKRDKEYIPSHIFPLLNKYKKLIG